MKSLAYYYEPWTCICHLPPFTAINQTNGPQTLKPKISNEPMGSSTYYFQNTILTKCLRLQGLSGLTAAEVNKCTWFGVGVLQGFMHSRVLCKVKGSPSIIEICGQVHQYQIQKYFTFKKSIDRNQFVVTYASSYANTEILLLLLSANVPFCINKMSFLLRLILKIFLNNN